MAYTATTALTEVRALINESTASFWSDTEIAGWIEQGCLDWCEKTLLLTKEDTLTLATNTYKYTTSGNSYIDNAIRVLHAEYSGRALKRLTYEQMRGHNQMSLATNSNPEYFYGKYNGTTFTVYIGDTPSVDQNGGTVTLIFSCRATDIADIPNEYQQHIFNYAASKAKMKERQWQEAQLLWQIYINNLSFARKDKLEIPQQTAEHFKEQ